MKIKYFDRICDKALELTDIYVRFEKRRKGEVVEVKVAVINIMSRYYAFSSVYLGKLFGNHHATILYHLKDHESRYMYVPSYAELFEELKKYTMSIGEDSVNLNTAIELMKSSLTIPHDEANIL
jgi:hypothetical protein